MPDNAFPVSINGTIPEASVRRLAEGVADFISPLTEAAGMLGDTIKGHREAAARNRVKVALERAGVKEIPLTPAPLKFIQNWTDAASLEDASSGLNELWENLLISGLSSYKSHLNAFVDILRRFGSDEASCLKKIVERSGELNKGSHSVPQSIETQKFPEWMINRNSDGLAAHAIWLSTLEAYNDAPKMGPTILGGIMSESESESFYHEPFFSDNYVSFDVLRKEGLVMLSTPSTTIETISSRGQHLRIHGKYSLHLAQLTQFGYAFARACIEEPTKR